MKSSKKSIAISVILTIIQASIGLACCFYVALSISNKLGKQFSLQNWAIVTIMISILIASFSAYFLLTVLPTISNGKGKFIKTLRKHSISFSIAFLFFMIILVALDNSKEYNDQNITDLINIEWAIFAITVGLFTIWEAIVVSKNEDIEKVEDCIGFERLKRIRNVQLKKIFNSGAIASMIFLSINLIALILTTAMYYTTNLGNEIIGRFSVVALYLCVNSLSIIFVECLLPMIVSKIQFDIESDYKEYDDDDELRKIALEEEMAVRTKKEALRLSGVEDIDKEIESFKQELINKRNVLNGENKKSKPTKPKKGINKNE